jgi:TPR repeat protein
MKRAIPAIVCLFLLTAAGGAAADSVSDQDMARRYFQAAQAGDDDAQFYLGALYSAGVGEPRSDEEAFRWFSRAADQGHAHAMLILGGLYAIGRGVQKDNVKAYKWAFIVNSGSKIDEFRNGSRQLMGQLEARMTPGEISQAKSEALNYHAVSTKAQTQTRVAPADDTSRAAPPQPAVATTSVAPAAPAPPPAIAPASQPAPARANTDAAEPGKSAKKSDMDDMLDRVPQGLRKRFGF